MGKSIRSKIKRMHRAEFRRTIGTEAYDAQLEKVTTILHDNVEKQTLKSIDKLADALDTTNDDNDDNIMEDDKSIQSIVPTCKSDKINYNVGIYEGNGENKVIVNKKSKRKQKHGYRMKAIVTTTKSLSSSASSQQTREKRKPKYFCSF